MSVLLGVIDEPIGVHPTSMFTNKVGGESDTENIKVIAQVIKIIFLKNKMISWSIDIEKKLNCYL